MRIALIAQYPVWDVAPEFCNVAVARRREHPVPWVRALARSLWDRQDVILRVFSLNRTIRRRVCIQCEDVDALLLPQRWPARWDAGLRFRLRALTLRGPIREFRPNVVHGMGFETGNALVASYLSPSSTAFVQGIVEYLTRLPSSWVSREIFQMRSCELLAAKRLQGIVAETEFAADWARRRAPQAVIRIIPHAVRPAFLAARPAEFPDSPVCFVYVGALLMRKGVDLLIKSFARMAKSQAMRLYIIGEGNAQSELRRIAIESGVAERVHFLGYMEEQKLIEILRQSRALVCPSRYDTSPNVITEAHALGLPVIASRVGGIPDMVDHGRDGLLFNDGHIDELTRAVELLASNKALAASMGNCGRNRVQTTNAPALVAERHFAFFEQILKRQTATDDRLS